MRSGEIEMRLQTTSKTLSPAPFIYPSTTVADEETMSGSVESEKNCAEGWRAIINEHLLTWWVRGTPDVADEDLEPPTKAVIDLAIKIATAMSQEKQIAPPLRVVPNGEGGLVFERWADQVFERFELRRELSMEYTVFKNNTLVDRKSLLVETEPEE